MPVLTFPELYSVQTRHKAILYFSQVDRVE
jgi:hypothetical protein